MSENLQRIVEHSRNEVVYDIERKDNNLIIFYDKDYSNCISINIFEFVHFLKVKMSPCYKRRSFKVGGK